MRLRDMKINRSWITMAVSAVVAGLMFSSCVTSYDSTGRPIQTVDPAAVAVGAVVLGAVAYSAGKNNHHHRGYHHRPRRYHHCY